MSSLKEYKPAVIYIKHGAVTAHIGKAVQEIELVADLDSLAEALRTMHRSDATPAELLAELVAKLTTPTPGAQV